MKISDFFDGRAEFEAEERIKQFVETSKAFDHAEEDSGDAQTLLIFRTTKQRTWFVVTSERLYCVLDDLRKDRSHLNWVMAKSELISGSDFLIDIKSHDKSADSGMVDVGEKHKNWLYTKDLFSGGDVGASIKGLIQSKMIDQ